MAAAEVKEGADEEEDSVERAVAFCFEYAAYAILGEETVQDVGGVGRGKVRAETGGGGLLLNGR